jgi:hypothetical protein
MTTLQLVLLRSYMITLGRMPVFANLLRMILVRKMIGKKNPSERYTASSRFFSIKELN